MTRTLLDSKRAQLESLAARGDQAALAALIGLDSAEAPVTALPTAPGVQSLAALTALSSHERADKMLRLVEDVPAVFHYDAQSTAVHDGTTIIRPSDLPTSGRWLKMPGGGVADGDGVMAVDAADTLQFWVSKGGLDTNTGASPSQAFLTVQKALSLVPNDSDKLTVIRVGAGEYVETLSMAAGQRRVLIIGGVQGHQTGPTKMNKWEVRIKQLSTTTALLALLANHHVEFSGCQIEADKHDYNPAALQTVTTGGVTIDRYGNTFTNRWVVPNATFSKDTIGRTLVFSGMPSANGAAIVIAVLNPTTVLAYGPDVGTETAVGATMVEHEASTMFDIAANASLMLHDCRVTGGTLSGTQSYLGVVIIRDSSSVCTIKQTQIRNSFNAFMMLMNRGTYQFHAEFVEADIGVVFQATGTLHTRGSHFKYIILSSPDANLSDVQATGLTSVDILMTLTNRTGWGGPLAVATGHSLQLGIESETQYPIFMPYSHVPNNEGTDAVEGFGGELVTKNWVDTPFHVVTSADYTPSVNALRAARRTLFSTGNTPRVFTLPTPTFMKNERVWAKKTDAGTGTVTVPNADAGVVLTLQYDSASFVSDGTVWHKE